MWLIVSAFRTDSPVHGIINCYVITFTYIFFTHDTIFNCKLLMNDKIRLIYRIKSYILFKNENEAEWHNIWKYLLTIICLCQVWYIVWKLFSFCHLSVIFAISSCVISLLVVIAWLLIKSCNCCLYWAVASIT